MMKQLKKYAPGLVAASLILAPAALAGAAAARTGACPMQRMPAWAARPGMARAPMGLGAMRPGGGPGGMRANMADMQQIHSLLANHSSIQRQVRKLPNGVETLTTSADPRIAATLVEHVNSMYARLREGRMIRGFDPLFVELFRHAGRIELRIERVAQGVRVVETSSETYAVKLIQAHADAVSGFVKDGTAAMHRIHPLPARSANQQR